MRCRSGDDDDALGDTMAKDPDEGKKDPDEGKHSKEDPSRADGKVPDGTRIDPREPGSGGKHGR